MSIPTAAFLDTSVLDGQNYNFSSKAFSTFVPACKQRAIKLLLPAPIEDEIKRHIKKRSRDALDALEAARRQAPFLTKWRHFPKNAEPDWEVTYVAHQEWIAFLRQFDVLRLDYDDVDLETVMGWYDATKAPFRDGKKRKEFPDAIAIAMLDAYAKKAHSVVAVVSFDDDMKLACERFPSLLYFRGLPALTELLLSDDGRIKEFHLAIQGGLNKLSDAIYEVLNLNFFHAEEGEFTLGDTFEYDHPGVAEVRVVGIGDREATVIFEAEVTVKYELRWTVQDEEGEEHYYTKIDEDISVPGSAKIVFDESIQNVAAVRHVEMDDAEIELRRTPSRW